ncbi:Histidine decarboxylase [Folsomia candida]|uniref:Histidine decarboxylase n=1 Tax=Folsomia candida TaxID=158441 RepID=A0A226F3I4_FOLCA|nr:Histidine decarboxylase [Folsomia candida]
MNASQSRCETSYMLSISLIRLINYAGKELVDFIADYLTGIRARRVFPAVQPGYMRPMVPDEAPQEGESFQDIFEDFQRIVLPGASSPACTELEMIVMDWLAKMIGLPTTFMHSSKDSKGGGVIQTTASEATFISLMAGRTEAIRTNKAAHPNLNASEINARLVAYCSDQAHSSVEKAGLIGLVRMHYLESDYETLGINGETLSQALKLDREAGLIPFWVCATLGTTGSCSFDNLKELGQVCLKERSAFICPEFRHWLEGVEMANSIHWQIALSKRFRALKLWFVLRSFGVTGLQEHIRKGVRLAARFEAMVASDTRFEIPAKRHLGMVVFRLRGDNELTETLLKRVNSSGKIHCVPASLKIKETARAILANEELKDIPMAPARKVPLGETRLRNSHFGTSLLLANSPMSPKIVNGSFAAIFDSNELFKEFTRRLKLSEVDENSPAVVRRRLKGMVMCGKQFSLDSRMDVVSTMNLQEKEKTESDSDSQKSLPCMPESPEQENSSN